MNRAADVQRTDWTADTDLGWLLHTITRRHSNLANDVLGSSVGGVRGYWILTVAATSARRQYEIGDQLGIDRTVLTHLLDDLEAAGLIQRTQDAGDRRARLVQITDQGRARSTRWLDESPTPTAGSWSGSTAPNKPNCEPYFIV
ncbi:MarR family winged helix-turn-helix transcriptional regulator [Kribbella italica]|uniref:DNA-binding HxlR family transcriptional regulator n=1 Tax=Kribbella italica TaxID=1540520 RepID=A0A7W9JH45_9ACTN|nr:MarR family transcriptional regulator [Kribbella italica]MBB5841647.1 DNA-binding HxlR family transcriptional regulator [Kribbella italica]